MVFYVSDCSCMNISVQEIIRDLKDMVKGMMRAFRSRNYGKRPEKILFYRDGVSEGQFQGVSCYNWGEPERAPH